MNEQKETNSTPVKKNKVASWLTGKLLVALFLIVVILSLITVLVLNNKKQPKVTTEMIMSQIVNASELTTTKMICSGLVKYSDNNIPYINEEAFSMTYSATVSVGIDMSAIKVEVTDSKVTISIPEIKILDINMNEESIQFYDKKFALFKDDSKEDVVYAIKIAKADVESKTDINNMKDMAKLQINALMTTLFSSTIGNRELVVNFTE